MGGRKLTTQDLARALDKSEDTVRKWAKRGCPHFRGRPLRFELREVDAWLRANGLSGRRGGHPGDEREPVTAALLAADAPPTPPDPDTDDEADEAETAEVFRGAPEDMIAALRQAKLRKELALAQRHELDNERKRGQLLEAAAIHDGFALVAARFRAAADKLQRKFGRDAYEILSEAIDAGEADVERLLSPPE